MRVHAIQTGRLIGNKVIMRGEGWPIRRALMRPDRFEFPVYAYVVEHDDGHIVIDTGLNSVVKVPRLLRRLLPNPACTAADEIGPQMQARGLRLEDVRLVIPTHLDWDHAGGVGHFPKAEIIVHRPEYEYAFTWFGNQRYSRKKLWPKWFNPKVFDLDAESYGPFPESLALTDRGDVKVVPIPGHSIGQVAVVISTDGPTLFFGADHMLCQEWFVDDVACDRLVMLGAFFPKLAVETSRRIARFVRETPRVLLPAHDADAARRLAGREPVKL